MHLAFHTTPTWTLKGRVETITKSNQSAYYPGPFDYSGQKKTERAPTFVIGKQTRDVFKVTQSNPGPGSYELKSAIKDGPKKSFGSRLEFPTKHTPGPQDYHHEALKIKQKQPQFSMSMRSKSYREIVYDNNLYKPAPTSYQTKGYFNNPKGVIGSSVRKDLTQTQKTPGPGSYLTLQILDKNKSVGSILNPRYSIGKNARKTDIQPLLDNPGPGTYEKSSFWDQNKAKLKGYTLRPQTTDLIALERARLPGPGYYDVTLKNKSKAPQYSSGSNKRSTFIDQARKSYTYLPPPGSHDAKSDIKFHTTTSFKFGHSNRRPLDETERTPGPGQYNNTKVSLLNQAPKFSLSKSQAKLDQFLKPRDANPAPNQYQPNHKLIMPGLKISELPHQQRPNYDKAKYMPGPGYYNIDKKEDGPTWKFGSQIRKPFTEQRQAIRMPGVGEYQVQGQLPNAPKYMNTSSKISFNSRRASK